MQLNCDIRHDISRLFLFLWDSQPSRYLWKASRVCFIQYLEVESFHGGNQVVKQFPGRPAATEFLRYI